MKKLIPPPAKTPLVDANGFMSKEWVLYFQRINEILVELQEAVLELQGGP